MRLEKLTQTETRMSSQSVSRLVAQVRGLEMGKMVKKPRVGVLFIAQVSCEAILTPEDL